MVWVGAGAAAVLAAPQAAEAGAWVAEREHVLGTSLRMIARGTDHVQARAAFAAAEAEIARLDGVLSGWRADSELSALNRSDHFNASPDLFAVVAACEHWRRASGGAFCARQGKIEAAWRDAEREDIAPSRARLAALAGWIVESDIALDVDTRAITRPPHVRFAPDGLAKGYVIDAALAAARQAAPDLDGMLIDIGGDVRVWGASPDADAWRIGISDVKALYDNAAPFTHLRVRNKAIATSGAGARDRTIAGRTYAHLIAPSTGWALEQPHQASVIADTAADADALATALTVLPPHEGLSLVADTPGAEALIANAQGGAWMSPGWSDLLQTSDACQATPAAAAGRAWPANFAVTVRYEVPRIEAADYERPYVVIWISDAQRRLVRTLLVLGDHARWRESNYVWWRRFERFDPAAVQAISRPTRAPGRYDLVWDGRNDQGQAMPQGSYTLTIEAAREHGGHSVQVIDLDLGASPAQQSRPAQPELGAVSVQYGAR